MEIPIISEDEPPSSVPGRPKKLNAFMKAFKSKEDEFAPGSETEESRISLEFQGGKVTFKNSVRTFREVIQMMVHSDLTVEDNHSVMECPIDPSVFKDGGTIWEHENGFDRGENKITIKKWLDQHSDKEDYQITPLDDENTEDSGIEITESTRDEVDLALAA